MPCPKEVYHSFSLLASSLIYEFWRGCLERENFFFKTPKINKCIRVPAALLLMLHKLLISALHPRLTDLVGERENIQLVIELDYKELSFKGVAVCW